MPQYNKKELEDTRDGLLRKLKSLDLLMNAATSIDEHNELCSDDRVYGIVGMRSEGFCFDLNDLQNEYEHFKNLLADTESKLAKCEEV